MTWRGRISTSRSSSPTIGEMFDDFVIDANKTVAGKPIGEGNMVDRIRFGGRASDRTDSPSPG